MNQNLKFKVKEFEWFEMQTRVRQLVQQIVTPVQKRILQHSTNMAKFKQTQQSDSLKVQQLTLMVTGDPKIFEIGIFKQVDKRFEVHQKTFQQLRRLIEQSNQFVDKKFSLLDLRMKQSNDVMLSFASLKQRINTEVQIQNENIQKVRQNLQNMISKVNQDIGKTNQRIVQNLMLCQKTDKSLQQRIHANEMAIELNKQAIERNRVGLHEKNILMEMHDFKIDQLYEKIKELDKGQSLNQKIQQYMKDMEISIRKCEFRVEAVTPLVTMAQLQQALEYILPQKLRKKIIIFGYKKYNKLNRQILDKNYDQVSEKFNGMQLVEMMQKRNMREVTSLKRKKIISMGIDIDHLTFQARQRYYQEVDMDELSQQQQDDKNTAKIDQAEILNLVSLYFNEFTTDVSEKVKNQLEDTKAYLYGMQSELKKQMQMNYQKAKKSQDHCLQFHRDQMLEMKSVMNQLEEVEENRREVEGWLVRGQEIERKFYNFCSLINHLQIQEEIDKQNISLMGLQQDNKGIMMGERVSVNGGNANNTYNPSNGIIPGYQNKNLNNSPQQQYNKQNILQLDDKCFSCCGYPASVLSSFKMACLAYHPSSIVIDGKEYKRQDVLEFTTNLLQTIKSSLQLNQGGNNNNPSSLSDNYDMGSMMMKQGNTFIQSNTMHRLDGNDNSRMNNNKSRDKSLSSQLRSVNSRKVSNNNNRKDSDNVRVSRTSQGVYRNDYNGGSFYNSIDNKAKNMNDNNNNNNNSNEKSYTAELQTLQRLGNNSKLHYSIDRNTPVVNNSIKNTDNNSNNDVWDEQNEDDNTITTAMIANKPLVRTKTNNNNESSNRKDNINQQSIGESVNDDDTIIASKQNLIEGFSNQSEALRLKSTSLRMRKSVKKNNVLLVNDDRRTSMNGDKGGDYRQKGVNHHQKSKSTHNHTAALSYQHNNNTGIHNKHNDTITSNNNSTLSKQMLSVTNNFLQLKKKHLNYLN